MPSFGQSKEKPLSSEEWYDTARAKINSFLRNLDPSLEVSVKHVDVMPSEESKKSYDTLALSFESENDPRLNWTMEIKEDSDYIENKLEGIVQKIYQEKKQG